MSRIFVSHNSRDNAVTTEIGERLRARGHQSIYIDFDPEVGIPAGRDWENDLYRELRACRALIVLCSPHSMASSWCFAEITHAKALGKPVFPIIVEDCEVHAILRGLQIIDWRASREEACERLWRGLKSAGVDAADEFAWDPDRCPYPGLPAFQEEDAAVYFGRGDEIQEGLEKLNSMRRFGGTASLLVLGPSGSGKSSLVRAGLVPRLRANPEHWLVLPIMRPRNDPVAELAASFASLRAALDLPGGDRHLAAAIQESATALPVLLEHARDIREASGQADARLVLVVDQAEELFTSRAAGQSKAFMGCIRAMLEPADTPFLVVWTLRSDFLDRIQQHPEIRGLNIRDLRLGPMDAADVESVIRGPAELVGLRLEAGLVQRIIQDMDTDDALPLLAFCLRELYQRFSDDGVLEIDEYNRLGGLTGSLANVAEELYQSIGQKPRQHDVLRHAVLAFARINQNGDFVRRTAARSEFSEDAQPILDQFVAARLLIAGRRGEGGESTYEVAHEALFRSWKRLRHWLEDGREFLKWQRRIGVLATEWEESRSHRSLLLKGSQFAEFERQLALHQRHSLGAREMKFIGACRKHRRRWAAYKAGMLVLLLVVLAGALLNSYIKSVETATRRMASQALHMAENPGSGAFDRSLLLAAAAYRIQDSVQNRSDLLEILQLNHRNNGFLRKVNWAHLGSVYGLAYSPDGRQIASGAEDGRVILWNAADGTSGGELPAQDGQAIYSLHYVLNGSVLATAHPNGAIRLWDLPSGTRRDADLVSGADGVWSLAWHEDRQLLAAGHASGEVSLWQFGADPAPARVTLPEQHLAGVDVLVFSPDGSLLVSAGQDGSARFWDMDTMQPDGEPLSGSSPYTAVELATFDGQLLQGEYLFLGSANGQIRVINPRTRATVAEVDSGQEGVDALLLLETDDRQLLLSGGADGSIRFWDPDVYEEVPPLFEGHLGQVVGLAASPSGHRLASASSDATVRLWSVSFSSPLLSQLAGWYSGPQTWAFGPGARLAVNALNDGSLEVLEGHNLWNEGRPFETGEEFGITALAVSMDERWIAGTDENNRVFIWSLDDGPDPVATGHGHVAVPHLLKFGPVRAGGPVRFASADSSGGLWLWLADESGQLSGRQLGGHRANINQLEFDASGSLLASADAEGRVMIWDVEAGRSQGHPLLEHEGSVNDLAFHPTEPILATTGLDARIRLWNAHSLTHLGPSLDGEGGANFALAFSPNGRYLAVGSEDTTVSLWDWRERALHRSELLRGHRRSVRVLAFSPDGRTLASGSDDGTTRFWDVESAQAIGQAFSDRWVEGGIEQLVFSGDGLRLFQLAEDQFVYEWNLDGIAVACEIAQRDLSEAEWDRYLGKWMLYEPTCPQAAAVESAP